MFPQILATVRRIPKGRVATYGDVAAASGHPGAARQVVWALRTADGVPWHRVVGARGRLLLPGEPGLEQRLRLQSEGVEIVANRIDLARYGHAFAALRAAPSSSGAVKLKRGKPRVRKDSVRNRRSDGDRRRG